MIKEITVVHKDFKEEEYLLDGHSIDYSELESFIKIKYCINYILDQMFKCKEKHLISLKESIHLVNNEIFNDVMRVCPGGIIKLSQKVVDYELTIIFKNIFDNMHNNNIIIFKLEQEYIIELIMKILSIVFVVINYASDSTLGNNYEMKYFIKAINQIEHIHQEYSKFKSLSKKHINYSFEFLDRIEYNLNNYILKFMKHKPTYDDAKDETWFHDEPFCWFMTNTKCNYCSKH